MNNLTLYNDDNLKVLHQLKASGQKFDLVELDGPYMAGLEDWDNMTEEEYIQHYAERLTLVRDVLKPWGVVFVFGYPEYVAEIKTWVRQNQVFTFRRWIEWYNQLAVHAARQIQTILVFESLKKSSIFDEFKTYLRNQRKALNLTVKDAMIACDINVPYVTTGERGGGGFLWFESASSMFPSKKQYQKLRTVFELPQKFESLQSVGALQGITNRSLLKVPVEKASKLNCNGLRSKPVSLYLQLFQSITTLENDQDALVLYGGSGNAGIAAACLNYNVIMCETNEKRCEAIRQRWGKDVKIWRERATAQLSLLSGDNKKMQLTKPAPNAQLLFPASTMRGLGN